MEYILVSILVLLVALWYRNFIKIYSYWKDKNVKTLPSLPFIGSYGELLKMKDHHITVMKKIYDQYSDEKYIGAYRFATPELLVLDPEIIRTILVKDFNNFVDRGFIQDGDEEILHQHLFLLHGEKWRALRQKMTPTFTSSKMRKMFPLLVECGEELEASIKERILTNNEMDIKDLMAKYTTDTIGTCAFGLQANSMKDEESPFRKMGKKIFQINKFTGFIRLIQSVLPSKIRNTLDSEKEIEDFFLNLVKELIKIRSTSSGGRQDFIQLMLELRESGSINLNNIDDSKLEITDELITAQCFVFFIAGFETSSTTMSYALRELALNPEIQNLLLKEIDIVLQKHEGKITYDAVQEMEYLDMVLDETLRMYPSLPILNRKCIATHRLLETDLILEKGVKIVIPTFALHRDPKHFPEPEKFKPERFSKHAEKTYHPFAYLPFGEGPRICIGARFGKLQSAIGLISFLKKYSVEPIDSNLKNLKLDPLSFLLNSKGGIPLRINSRIKQ